jgi:hypothetical protein
MRKSPPRCQPLRSSYPDKADRSRGSRRPLSRFFIHNPLLLEAELKELDARGISPEILADPQGQVTTPWDMMINQIAEEARDAARHGSCGLGINETLRRGADARLVIRARDLRQPDRLERLSTAGAAGVGAGKAGSTGARPRRGLAPALGIAPGDRQAGAEPACSVNCLARNSKTKVASFG